MHVEAALRLEPEALGPVLGGAEAWGPETRLFPGEAGVLSRRELERRGRLLELVTPMLRRVLEDGERLLYLAPANAVPGILEQLGLGVMWAHYNRVALAFTERRIVEILLDGRGAKVESRTRSYPLSQLAAFRVRGRTVMVRQEKKRWQRWRLVFGRDRRVVKPLLAWLSDHGMGLAAAQPRPVPVWHCPECGAATAEHPVACARCGTRFRSPRLAALLSLAIPGGGLFYSRRPGLGALDLAGELVLAGVVASAFLASAGGKETIAVLGMALLFLAMTKLESVHLARLLTARTVPEQPNVRRWWSRAAVAGGVLSLVVIAVPPLLAGSLVARLDHDLDLSAPDLGWEGGFDRAAWEFGVDEGERSEWRHPTAGVIWVFGTALRRGVSLEDLRRELERRPSTFVRGPEPFSSGTFHGLAVRERLDDGSEPLVRLRYFVFDDAGRDVHTVVRLATPEAVEPAAAELEDLLARARWVKANVPAS